MRLSDFAIEPKIGPMFEKKLEEIMEGCSPNLYDSAVSDIATHVESGASRDGYISFCDGAVTTSVILEAGDGASYAFMEAGADDSVRRMIDACNACATAAELARIAEESGVGEGPNDWIIEKLDRISISSFLKNPQEVWTVLDKTRDALGDPEIYDAEGQRFRLSIGAVYDADRDDPFYLYISANFDDPYYRTDSEIRRDAGPGVMKCDYLMAEASGPVPQDRKELKEMLDGLVSDAFPKLELKEAPKNGPRC